MVNPRIKYKRFLLVAVCMGLAVMGCAQGAKGSVKRIAQKTVPLSAGAKRMHALRESPMFRPVVPTKKEDLRVFFEELEDIQRQDLAARYDAVMKDFTDFKHYMDVRLFYQTLPGESRPFSVHEKREIFRQMGSLYARIRALKAGAFRQDGALEASLDYLNEAAGRVDPTFKNMFGGKGWPRANRVYNTQEFLLQTPASVSWGAAAKVQDIPFFAYSRSKSIMEKLPLRQVAVLNDNEKLLAALKQWYKRGGFGNKAQWSFYSHAQALQYDLQKGKQFDLILTDMVVPGGGGALIASELRQNNIPTALLALTQYVAHDALAQKFYSYGIDGMISIKDSFGSSPKDMLRLVQKIKNYFYYRDLHHWPY